MIQSNSEKLKRSKKLDEEESIPPENENSPSKNKKNEREDSQNIKKNDDSVGYKIGDYYIKKTIGEGTFGKVKLGIYEPTQKVFAIKVLEKNRIGDKEDSIRVKREFDMLSKFNHPNVILVTEIFESVDSYYCVMEYCECGELFNYIVDKGKLSDKESAFFYYQIINGLEYIHSLGIVHRDLKPENLLLTKDHLLKIIDFGLSNYFIENQEDLLVTPCGSPCYASPEMVAGKKYDGVKIDVWSTGIILYAMLCGYLPFEDKDNDVLFDKIMECKPDFPETMNEEAKDLILKILITDPEKRITIPEIKKHSFFLKGEELFNKYFIIKEIKDNKNEENQNEQSIKSENIPNDAKDKTNNEDNINNKKQETNLDKNKVKMTKKKKIISKKKPINGKKEGSKSKDMCIKSFQNRDNKKKININDNDEIYEDNKKNKTDLTKKIPDNRIKKAKKINKVSSVDKSNTIINKIIKDQRRRNCSKVSPTNNKNPTKQEKNKHLNMSPDMSKRTNSHENFSNGKGSTRIKQYDIQSRELTYQNKKKKLKYDESKNHKKKDEIKYIDESTAKSKNKMNKIKKQKNENLSENIKINNQTFPNLHNNNNNNKRLNMETYKEISSRIKNNENKEPDIIHKKMNYSKRIKKKTKDKDCFINLTKKEIFKHKSEARFKNSKKIIKKTYNLERNKYTGKSFCNIKVNTKNDDSEKFRKIIKYKKIPTTVERISKSIEIHKDYSNEERIRRIKIHETNNKCQAFTDTIESGSREKDKEIYVRGKRFMKENKNKKIIQNKPSLKNNKYKKLLQKFEFNNIKKISNTTIKQKHQHNKEENITQLIPNKNSRTTIKKNFQA